MRSTSASASPASPLEFADFLKQRRMVRRFSTDPVPKDALERIARAAKRAPSACFSQAQRLLIVTDPALMARAAAWADEESYADIAYHRSVSQSGRQFIPT